jgi:glycosyltransferase involved in cell wall biosynthesis
MKLSILIPTHNRPHLFDRCLKSVLCHLTDEIEVIVNNDSRDITEIRNPQVQYYYDKFNNLSEIYQSLLNRAKGEYVYFLEDDDFLTKDFSENLALDADLIGGNYFPTYDIKNVLAMVRQCKDRQFTDFKSFASQLNLEHLQLSQYIFKRATIIDFEFPMDNNVHNDIKLVLHSARNASSIKTMSKVLYCQTIDGGDNLSFEGSSTQINITKSLEFLEEYELQSTTSH